MKIIFKSIGTIYTPYKSKENMPIQPKGAKDVKGKIILDKNLEKGLDDLIGFSHIILIYYFDKSFGFNLKTKPFLDETKRGVFSTRAPKRPNNIGLSVVELIDINENILFVKNVDMLDETPLLDIKPYIPKFDVYSTKRNGWINQKIIDLNTIKSDNRFS